MVKIQGKSVFGGVAIGPIGILKKKDKKVIRNHVEQVEEEIKRCLLYTSPSPRDRG